MQLQTFLLVPHCSASPNQSNSRPIPRCSATWCVTVHSRWSLIIEGFVSAASIRAICVAAAGYAGWAELSVLITGLVAGLMSAMMMLSSPSAAYLREQRLSYSYHLRLDEPDTGNDDGGESLDGITCMNNGSATYTFQD